MESLLEKIYNFIHLPPWAIAVALAFVLASPLVWRRDDWRKPWID
jgi:hypothetical protein